MSDVQTSKQITRYGMVDEPMGGGVMLTVMKPHLTGSFVRYDDIKHLLHPETTCQWTEIEEGTGVFNTCKAGEEWHVPEGLEPYPFCPWCGKSVVIAEPACTECGAAWGEHRLGCSQIDPADFQSQVKASDDPHGDLPVEINP